MYYMYKWINCIPYINRQMTIFTIYQLVVNVPVWVKHITLLYKQVWDIMMKEMGLLFLDLTLDHFQFQHVAVDTRCDTEIISCHHLLLSLFVCQSIELTFRMSRAWWYREVCAIDWKYQSLTKRIGVKVSLIEVL